MYSSMNIAFGWWVRSRCLSFGNFDVNGYSLREDQFLLDFSWTLEKLEMQFGSVRFGDLLKTDLLAMEFEI